MDITFCLLWCLISTFKVLSVPLANFRRGYRSRSTLPIPIGITPNVIESIATGTQMAIDHCQNVFQWDRWNCPKTTFTRQQKLLPTKETAFAKAIVAAGIAHAITKNCSRGEINGCGCDLKLGTPQFSPLDGSMDQISPHPKENLNKENIGQTREWCWGGCSDNPSYALRITKKFLDGLEKGTDAIAYVSRHNLKIGREVIVNTMVRKCRCHGISGSCTLQTCWMQVASFGEISRKLKERYRKSLRLTYRIVESSIFQGNSPRDILEEREIEGTQSSLIFLDQSPDYCLANAVEGFAGTKGRMCSRNPNHTTMTEKNSCRNLCKKCGHNVKKIKKNVTTRCNCNFVWCCDVKCDTCKAAVEEYFCD